MNLNISSSSRQEVEGGDGVVNNNSSASWDDLNAEFSAEIGVNGGNPHQGKGIEWRLENG
jgi:hypothetical protein